MTKKGVQKLRKNANFTTSHKPIHGFTLIELLVVIAIIALLLSIVVPSLRQVRERAQYMVCQTHQRGIFQAMAAYATENNNRNLDRGDTDYYKLSSIAHTTAAGNVLYDLRQSFSPYFGDQLQIFNCPLTRSTVDFMRTPARQVDSSYGLFTAVEFGADKNTRFGEPFHYDGRRYYVMVGDWIAFSRVGQGIHSSHPGRRNNLALAERDDSNFAFSRYEDLETNNFGQQRYNFVYVDGSSRSFQIGHEDLKKDSSDRFVVDSEGVPLYDLPPFNPRAIAHGIPEWMTLVPSGR